jgi:uncharacterized protein (TIGR02453 family)
MFTKSYIKFFKDLAKNNEREWFHANKKRYEEDVKQPFTDFVQQMIDLVKEQDPTVLITPKEAMFRIFRDTRFSKDKTPYKLKMSAVISKGGRKDHSHPGIYVEIGADEVGVYSGAWGPDKNQLQGIRETIASNPKAFRSIIEDKKFVKLFGAVNGEKNKRIPKEFVEVAEKEPLIFNKSFYVFTKMDAESILKKDFNKKVLNCYEVAQPFGKYLSKAMASNT